MSDEQAQYTSLSSSTSSVSSNESSAQENPRVAHEEGESSISETSTPPPSRSASDASDHSPELGRSVGDLNEFQVTSHNSFVSATTDSDSEPFDEKVLETEAFKWNVLPVPSYDPTSQPVELSTFHSNVDPPKLEEDSDDDLPPLIDATDEQSSLDDIESMIDKIEEKIEALNSYNKFDSTTNHLDRIQHELDERIEALNSCGDKLNSIGDRLDRIHNEIEELKRHYQMEEGEDNEYDEETDENTDVEEQEDSDVSEDEVSEDHRLRVRVAHEYPTLIRILFLVFLFLHLIHHAFLLKERREYEKNLCFMYRF